MPTRPQPGSNRGTIVPDTRTKETAELIMSFSQGLTIGIAKALPESLVSDIEAGKAMLNVTWGRKADGEIMQKLEVFLPALNNGVIITDGKGRERNKTIGATSTIPVDVIKSLKAVVPIGPATRKNTNNLQ